MQVHDQRFTAELDHCEEILFQTREEQATFNHMVVPGCQVTVHSIGFSSGRWMAYDTRLARNHVYPPGAPWRTMPFNYSNIPCHGIYLTMLFKCNSVFQRLFYPMFLSLNYPIDSRSVWCLPRTRASTVGFWSIRRWRVVRNQWVLWSTCLSSKHICCFLRNNASRSLLTSPMTIWRIALISIGMICSCMGKWLVPTQMITLSTRYTMTWKR